MTNKATHHKVSKTVRPYTVALIYHAFDTQKDTDKYFSKENQHIDEDTELTVKEIKQALHSKKYKVQIIKINEQDLSAIKTIKADYIFNLADSKAMEIQVANMLERMHIPYSGSCSTAIRNSNNKVRAKGIFTKHGLPTPAYTVIEPGMKITRSMLPGKFPLIVKPAYEHGSVGITDKSVITTFKQLQKHVVALRQKLKQTLICEQFIKGKEVQILILETHSKTIAFPPAEMIFRGSVKSKWNIYGYTEKWRKDRKIYQSCWFIAPPKQIPDPVIYEMQRDAIKAFYAFGFRDYGRFDFRYHPKSRKWYFLEGNANPGLSTMPNEAGMTAITAQGMSFADFVVSIIANSLPVPSPVL